MLNDASERCTEQRMVVVKTRSRSKIEGKEMASQNGQAPSSDSVSPMTSVTESNYNGVVSRSIHLVFSYIQVRLNHYNSINYHMKSGRNLAVIRRRAQRLRQRDMEIRKRLEKVNRKAKPIDDDSPTSQGLTSKTGTTQIKPPSTSCIVTVPSEESGAASPGSTDLKSWPDTGREENDSQSNLNVTNGTVSPEDKINVTPYPETDSEVYGKLLDLKTLCDGVSANDDMETDCGGSRREVTTPAEHIMEMSVTSTTEEENMEWKSSTKNITNENVENESSKIDAVKLKAFVGERYCFNKAKTLSKSTNKISKEEILQTPKRSCNKQAMSFYLADLAAPCSLGISPKRIQHHKSSKKTRMPSTLTSTFTGSMNFSKMKLRKTILNILKTDRRACNSEVF